MRAESRRGVAQSDHDPMGSVSEETMPARHQQKIEFTVEPRTLNSSRGNILADVFRKLATGKGFPHSLKPGVPPKEQAPGAADFVARGALCVERPKTTQFHLVLCSRRNRS